MFKNAKFYILLSTFTKKDYDDITAKRNEAVIRIAEKHGIDIINLYSVSKENGATLCSDDVHFTDQGYELLAKEILSKI